MRRPRNVTDAPTGMPLRTLKVAIDLRARLTIGFWSGDGDQSLTPLSMALALEVASPKTHIDYDFCQSRDLQVIGVTEFLFQVRNNFLLVSFLDFDHCPLVLLLTSIAAFR